jgi:hypothetical protein
MKPFEGCWKRVERADAHRKTLAEAWNSFIEDDPYSVSVRMEHDGTGRIWVRPRYSALPASFALELGEMLYQFRAALDGCVYDAAILETRKNPPPDEKGLAFPICPSAKEFENAAWHIAPLLNDRRDIIESVQPYNTPKLAPELMVLNFNRTLGILHDWARKDRHRQLHVIGSWGSNANPKVRFPDDTNLAYMTVIGSGFLEDEGHIATFKLDGFTPGMNVQANPDLAIDIAVNEIPPPCADNDTLGNRLLAMSVASQSIIGAFKKSFGVGN